MAVGQAGRQQAGHQAAGVAAADEVAGAGHGLLQETQGLVEVVKHSITQLGWRMEARSNIRIGPK